MQIISNLQHLEITFLLHPFCLTQTNPPRKESKKIGIVGMIVLIIFFQ